MNHHIFAMLFGGVLVLLLFAGGAFGADDWWNESWQYRRAITINNIENPHDLFDYQVKIVVPRFKGMNYNFSDIRFTYKSGMESEINYWIENFTNESAIVWVKVPFIPKNSNTTIYMYYGNPPASSASNGTATFEFFDDFEGTSLDTTKWTVHKDAEVSYSVSDSKLIISGYGGAHIVSSPIGITAPFIMRTKVSGYGTTHWDLNPIGYVNSNDHWTKWVLFDSTWIRYGSSLTGYSHGSHIGVDSTGWSDTSCDAFYTFEGKIYADGSSDLITPKGTFSTSNTNTPNANRVMLAYWRVAAVGCPNGRQFDWVSVRKYTEPEPTATIGVEQSKDFYISLNTNKANYSTGDVVNLAIEVNRTQENPQVMKFKLELEDLDGKPDTLIETGSFVMPAKFHKKVVLRFIIPESPFVSSGRYAFKAYLIEPSLGEILAYDAVYFYVKEKEAKAKEQQSEAFAAFSLVEG